MEWILVTYKQIPFSSNEKSTKREIKKIVSQKGMSDVQKNRKGRETTKEGRQKRKSLSAAPGNVY